MIGHSSGGQRHLTVVLTAAAAAAVMLMNNMSIHRGTVQLYKIENNKCNDEDK